MLLKNTKEDATKKKRKRMAKEANSERREGVSYQSNCGLSNVADLVADNFSATSNVQFDYFIQRNALFININLFRSTSISRHDECKDCYLRFGNNQPISKV